jgi:pimeloyl-ACP methyl ester carboxylesterase
MHTPDGTAFDLHGPKTAPVVVLIHGLGLNRALWDHNLPALTPQFQVLTYDLLGHGQTPLPVKALDLTLLAKQVAKLLDHLQIKSAAIVGFSLGGMIARRFAQDYPARCQALGILHSPHRRTPDAQAAIVARVAQVRAEGPAATVEAALARWFTDDFRANNPDMMSLVRDWVLTNDPATYPLAYSVFADGVAQLLAVSPAIACPTLVLTGSEDFGNSPEMAHAIAAEIPGAETTILPGLRHMALMENPALTNLPLADFLKRALNGQKKTTP